MTNTRNPVVPCRFCGIPTEHLDTRECAPCHMAVVTLPHLLRSEAGRAYVAGELGVPTPDDIAEVRAILERAANPQSSGAHRRMAQACLDLLDGDK